VEVYLFCEAAIEEIFPSNVMLTLDEVFERVRVIRGVDRGCWPMLKAQEKETFGVVRATPGVAVITNCAKKVLEERDVRCSLAFKEMVRCFSCMCADGAQGGVVTINLFPFVMQG